MSKGFANQKNERWVSNEGDGGGKLPLVAARVGPGAPVGVRGQAEPLQPPLGVLKSDV